MATRSRRIVVAVASLAFVALGVACVDLFHSTDFDTLCTKSPGDPSCATDGMVVDVVADTVKGSDSAVPHVDFCAWSSTEARAQAERACAWLGACERPVGESLFGPCVVHAQLAYDCAANPSLRPRGKVEAFWACLSSVKTCGDVDRCVFPSGVNPCNDVNGTSTACGTGDNDSVLIECSGPAGRAHGVEPCVLMGQTCTLAGDKSLAKCSGALGFSCSDGGTCSGTSSIACQPFGILSLDQGVDCASYGAGTCSVGDAGSTCTPTKTANTCVEDTRPLCDGNVARTCLAGEDIRIDCTPLSLTCDSTVGGGSTITDPSSPCMVRGASACTGDDTCPNAVTLRSCGRGKAHDVDCQSVGLGQCKIDSQGRGACSPPP